MTPNRRSQRARMMELGRTMAPVKNGLDVGIAGDNPPGANREFFQLAEGGLWTTADFDTGQSPDRVLDITGTIPDDMKHQYDLVCCTQVLEHVWDLAQAADGLWVLTGWGGAAMTDAIVCGLDGYCDAHAGWALPLLDQLYQRSGERFKATLFAIPGRLCDEALVDAAGRPYLEIAAHGWGHALRECEHWTQEQTAAGLARCPAAGRQHEGDNPPATPP